MDPPNPPVSTDGSRPTTTASPQSSRPDTPTGAPPPATTTTNDHAENKGLSFTESWMYWKKRQGSAEGQNRRESVVDPLSPHQEPTSGNGTVQHASLNVIEGQRLVNNQANGDAQKPWSSYINPFSYVSQDLFNLQLPSAGTTNSDEQSQHSSTTTRQDTGWFSWIWGGDKHDEDEDHAGTLNSAEMRKALKDCKKLVQSPDTVWAWLNEPLEAGNESQGEMSVMGTKTETRPVAARRFPNKAISATPPPKDHPAQVEPVLTECYRQVTTRTKVRLTTQLYYNFSKEKHLYLKRNVHSPHIRNVLLVSVVGQTKSKHNVTSKHISDLTTEAVKNWFTENNPHERYHLKTISLEAGKLGKSSLEDVFILLTNWRESLKNANYLMITGFKNTFPLASILLDTLISRKFVTPTTTKLALHSIEGTIPGPYLDEQDSSTVSYIPQAGFEAALSRLLYMHNTKITLLGSLSNIPASLALHLEHSNIFRTIYIPHTTYDNQFEVHLLRLLLMAHNLGHMPTRLILQLSRYFQQTTVIADELTTDMFTSAVYNPLSTTRLLKPRPLETFVIEDPILTNNYNLVWTLHAFVDDFKTIKNINSLARIKALLAAYKTWDPQSKQLKDLKYMLEVLRIDDYSGAILRE